MIQTHEDKSPDAPYNEVDYKVEYNVTISGVLMFQGRPDLTEEERGEMAKEVVLNYYCANNPEIVGELYVTKVN